VVRSEIGGLAHLSPPLVNISKTVAAPPFVLFEGWEARAATLSGQAALSFNKKDLDPK
jgi:hypothetical protein